jgi:hypothetical protein
MIRYSACLFMVALLVGGAPFAHIAEVAQDDTIETIRTRANAGSAEAQNALGEMWENGRGVPQDFGEAMAWYRKAAEQGHADAQKNLGSMYYSDKYLNFVEAVVWYRKAAEQGHVEAQYMLGATYGLGKEGVPRDYIEAYKWFSLAATYAGVSRREEFALLRDVSVEMRDNFAKRLTAEQLSEAQKVSREWFEAHPPD